MVRQTAHFMLGRLVFIVHTYKFTMLQASVCGLARLCVCVFKCYSCNLGLVFSNSQQESIITSILTNSALKPVFAPNSLLCFLTLGMVSQHVSHI